MLLAMVMAGGLAHAAQDQGLGVQPAVQPFLGLHLFVGQDGFGVGLDADVLVGAFATWRGGAVAGPVVGPYVQVELIRLQGPSIAVGARGGVVAPHMGYRGFFPLGALLGDVGYSLAPDVRGLRVAGQARSVAFQLGFGGTRDERTDRWRQLNGSLGLSLAVPTDAYAIDGRPLRHAGRILRPAGGLLRSTATARHWLDRARDEAAAVLAFRRLASELFQAGAPAVLVRRTLAAAHEEVGHARMCLAQAARHGGGAWLGDLPDLPPRPAPSHTAALARVAWEGRWDGHHNEGRAAKQAAARAGRARDPRARAVEARIAVEELAHAVLGDELEAWAMRAGGAAVRRAVDGPPPA